MPKNNEIKWEEYFNLPNPGLRSYFDIVERGQPEEFRTTFAKGKRVDEVLAEWMPHLESLKDSWPTLWDFENDLAKKVGPMSIMKPLKERMDDIDSYYDSILLESKPLSDSAVAAVIAEWRKVRGLHIRGQDETIRIMKKSTNSGAPYFTKRRNVVDKTKYVRLGWGGYHKDDHHPNQFLKCKRDHDYYSDDGDLWWDVAVLGWRGQEGGPTDADVKQRVVWMFPFGVNICELQCYQVLIEAAQKHDLVPAWVSMESVDQCITRLFDTKGPDDLIVCTDFSKFDQHFNHDMQECSKKILTRILDNSVESEVWLEEVFPVKYCIPLAYAYGKVRYGDHGMGSGSGGTNADETLAHRALQYEAAINAGQRLNPNSQCLGDDGILSYPGITVEDVVRSYTAHGQEMNESKQYASKQDCTYLRRWHHKDYRVSDVCVGVYATSRALGRLCEQERYYDPEIWGAKMVALRQLSIIENVKFHPLKEQFVEFCMERDKFRLGLDIPGFLDHIEDEAAKATEIMPDFLGYTKSMMPNAAQGISSWWIIQYLKSKR